MLASYWSVIAIFHGKFGTTLEDGFKVSLTFSTAWNMTETKTRKRTRRSRPEQDQTPEPPPVWPGINGGRFAPLSSQERSQVDETVLLLLETLGLSQAIPSLIERVQRCGGALSNDGRLLFPRELVSRFLDQVRRDVILYSRRDDLDLDLSGDHLHMSSGGGAPGVLDFERRGYREGTAQDLYNAARIVDCMEHIHHFSRSIVATDARTLVDLDVNTAYACLAGTSKHVSVSITEAENVPAIADICYRLAGGEAAFRERPFLTVMVCHVVPPMRFAEEALAVLEAAVLAGFPVQLISAGQAGATSPATIAGSLVQAVAESLAGCILAWLVDPKARIIFAPKPLVADLRTGAMCGGGGEQAVLMAGAAQMGRHYDLPTSSIAGITDAKIPDAQHGAEKCLAVSLAAHAGSNLITQACGMQASLLGVSLEAYVIDNDMLGNILRTVRGVEANVENLSREVIDEVCRGEGHYLGHAQTLERMKRDYVYPELGDRQTPADWEAEGSKDILCNARTRMLQILESPAPSYINPDVESYIRQHYNILVSYPEMGD